MTNNDPNKRQTHGSSTVKPVARKTAWLPWLIGALILLALVVFGAKACSQPEPVASVPASPAGAAPVGTPGLGVEKVGLPGGQFIDLEPKTLNYELQRFLASSDAAPREFTFDHLNFATGSAALPADAQATVSALARILTAYPKANVMLKGYADARGTDAANNQLGARRAQAVATALIVQGVVATRIKTESGGETNPVDTNATASGEAENRRTALIVTTK